MLRLLSPGISIYVRGSVASNTTVHGLSDIDVIACTGESISDPLATARLRSNFHAVQRRIPLMKDLVEVSVISTADARRAIHAPYQVGSTPTTAMTIHPGGGARLYGPLRDWRNISGLDIFDSPSPGDPTHRSLWTWLDLQHLWRHTFRLCSNPDTPHATYFCVKSLAELVRLWAWLEYDQKLPLAPSTLERAGDYLHDNDTVFTEAAKLWRKLHLCPPPPTEPTVSALLRTTEKFARRLDRMAAGAGRTEVQIVGDNRDELLIPTAVQTKLHRLAGNSSAVHPLVDWRARVMPTLPDELFVPIAGDPSNVSLIGNLAGMLVEGAYVALRNDNVMVYPCRWHGARGAAMLRAVQCPVSDPISFALSDGHLHALFPRLPGWSAEESARRALVELNASVVAADTEELEPIRRLALLLELVRAGLFHESLRLGKPMLALSISVAIRLLGERYSHLKGVLDDGYQSYCAARLSDVDPCPDLLFTLQQNICTWARNELAIASRR